MDYDFLAGYGPTQDAEASDDLLQALAYDPSDIKFALPSHWSSQEEAENADNLDHFGPEVRLVFHILYIVILL